MLELTVFGRIKILGAGYAVLERHQRVRLEPVDLVIEFLTPEPASVAAERHGNAIKPDTGNRAVAG
jgi:hypothetical protein